MSESKPILYTDAFWISPFVYTVFVALHEKGIPFEARSVALQDKAQKRPEYRDKSLTGLVPSLELDGEWLAESSAIVEFIEETWPSPSVLPADRRERARARMVLSWLRSDLGALRQDRPTTTMFYERAKAPLTPAGAEAAEKLIRVTSALLDGKRQIGSSWSIADSDLAFMLHRLILNGHELPAAVRSYAETQWARPSTRAFCERERIPLVPY
jgi:glutathione S-transferase